MTDRRFPSPSCHGWPRTLAVPLLLLLLATTTASSVRATAVTFRHRPDVAVNSVHLAGSFNQWDTSATPMENDDGVWEVTVDLPPGRHQYKFVLDGGEWVTDDWATEFADDGFGGQNAVVVVGEEAMVAGYGSRERGPGGEEIPAGPEGTPVTFRFRPPDGANAVSVAGDFNDWNAAAHPLRDEDGDGTWTLTIELATGSHAFQFVVDGDDWVDMADDPNAEPDGFGGHHSRVEVGSEPLVVGHGER